MSAKDKPHDPPRDLADELRSKGGVETRAGVLQAERVEYLRGKDFVRWVKANPDKTSRFYSGGKQPEEQVRKVGELLLRRGLLVRCERAVKKPAPGAKKLVKFPRKLVLAQGPERLVFVEEAFYAYTYDRPTSPWLPVLAALGALGALLVCLFPLAPLSMRVGVFYLLVALLSAIMLLLVLRLLVAGVTWIATARTVWILPNLFREDVPLSGLFSPVVSVEAPLSVEEGGSKWGSHPLVRLAVAASLAGLLHMLYSHSPDKTTVVKGVSRYRDELFDVLGMQYQRIGNTTSNGTAATAADAAEQAADGGDQGSSDDAAVDGEEEEGDDEAEKEVEEGDEWEVEL